MSTDDIDSVLHEAGEHWRAALPEARHIDRSMLTSEPDRRLASVRFTAALLGVGILAVSAAVLVSSLPGSLDAPVGVTATAAAGAIGSPESPRPAAAPSTAVPDVTHGPAMETATPTVSSTLTDRELSDRYWGALTHFGLYGWTYDSLAEITRDSHLVVRGRVTDLRSEMHQGFEEGEFMGRGVRVVYGIVTVHEVLKGVPETRVPGTVEVAQLGWEGLTVADLPQHDVILFLKNYAQMRVDEGAAPSEDPPGRYYYRRPNGYQCVLRNIEGQIEIIDGPRGWQDAFGPFPSGLVGRSFDDVAAQIRQIAQSPE